MKLRPLVLLLALCVAPLMAPHIGGPSIGGGGSGGSGGPGGAKLPLSGGTMVAPGSGGVGINMGGATLTGLPTPVNSGDAVPFGSVPSSALFLRKDGTVTPTASLPFGGFKATGLAAGSAPGDAEAIEPSGFYSGLPPVFRHLAERAYPPVFVDFSSRRDLMTWVPIVTPQVAFYGASTSGGSPTVAFPASSGTGAPTFVNEIVITNIGTPSNSTGQQCLPFNGYLECNLGTTVSTGVDIRSGGDFQTTMDGDGTPGNNATLFQMQFGFRDNSENNHVHFSGPSSSTTACLNTTGSLICSNAMGFRAVIDATAATADIYFTSSRGATVGAETLIADDVPTGTFSGMTGAVAGPRLAFRAYGDFSSGTATVDVYCTEASGSHCVSAVKTLTGVTSGSVAGTSFNCPNRLRAAAPGFSNTKYYIHEAGVNLNTAAQTLNNYTETSFWFSANTMERE